MEKIYSGIESENINILIFNNINKLSDNFIERQKKKINISIINKNLINDYLLKKQILLDKYDIVFIDYDQKENISEIIINCKSLIPDYKNEIIIMINNINEDIDYLINSNYIYLLDEYIINEKKIYYYRINKYINTDDLLLFKYKKYNKMELYQKIEELYHNKNDSKIFNILCDYYINLFKSFNDKDFRLVCFYNAITQNNIEKKIKLYENLLCNTEIEDYIESWITYNLSLLYNKSSLNIPKIIHMIYLKEREFYNYNLRCIKSIIHYCHNYKIILYNDIEPINNIYWDELKEIENLEIRKINRIKYYDGYPIKYVQYEADILRLELLYEYGGIYLDTDILLIKNIDNLLIDNKGLYISRENGDSGGLINSFLASKPKNEFVKIWLDNFKIGLRTNIWAYHIRDTNKLLLELNPHYKIKYDIEILNGIHFFPFLWNEKHKFNDNNIILSEMTYGVHLFETILHDTLKDNNFLLNYYRDQRIIVTLTSTTDKLNDSIMNQTIKPDKIIINIPKKYDIKNISTNELVEINICEKDYGKATNIFGLSNILDKINDNDLIIVLDNDIIYDTNLIEILYNNNKLHSDKILTLQGYELDILFNGEYNYKKYKFPRYSNDKNEGYVDILCSSNGYSLKKNNIISLLSYDISINIDDNLYINDIIISGYLHKSNYDIYLINNSSKINDIMTTKFKYSIEFFKYYHNIWKNYDNLTESKLNNELIEFNNIRNKKINYLKNDSCIGNFIKNGNYWEEWMFKYIQQYYIKNTNMIDIGGNIGTTSLLMSEILSVNNYIYTFEPIFYDILVKNVNDNNLQNSIIVYPYGLGNIYQIIKTNNINYHNNINFGATTLINYTNYNNIDNDIINHNNNILKNGDLFNINLLPLDNFNFDNISLIKIDVEHMEILVLEGSYNTIKRCKPTILIETYQLDNLKKSLIYSKLLKLGYTIKNIYEGYNDYIMIIE